jgi:hypothetical protein
LWLNATGTPVEIAARTGNCVRVLPYIHTLWIGEREDLIGQQIEDALVPDSNTLYFWFGSRNIYKFYSHYTT